MGQASIHKISLLQADYGLRNLIMFSHPCKNIGTYFKRWFTPPPRHPCRAATGARSAPFQTHWPPEWAPQTPYSPLRQGYPAPWLLVHYTKTRLKGLVTVRILWRELSSCREGWRVHTCVSIDKCQIECCVMFWEYLTRQKQSRRLLFITWYNTSIYTYGQWNSGNGALSVILQDAASLRDECNTPLLDGSWWCVGRASALQSHPIRLLVWPAISTKRNTLR